jgi:hypothetical protein
MKSIVFFCVLITFSNFAQDKALVWSPNKKGSFYIYWGWNRSAYTKSTITFAGNDYNFTLHKVIANDRQSPYRTDIYLNPKNMTIPQFNLRLGYYFKDKYEISIGTDHMKYVMKNDQTVKMDGSIQNSGTPYDGTYENSDKVLTRDFLLFEHTDGLNYLNVEVRRSDLLFGNKWFTLSGNYGIGVGALIPRTNTTLLNNARYDQFHLAGWGSGLVGAVRMNFFKYFFIQSEAKYGFIHMPDIRTTINTSDRAKQHFWFMEYTINFGAQFQISNREKKAK